MGYLIEFRFFGKSQTETKSLIKEVKKKFKIRTKYRAVPHISIVGPIRKCSSHKQLVRDFIRTCKEFQDEKIRFEIEGFGTFRKSRVLFLDIKPNRKFKKFRRKLIRRIRGYTSRPPYDKVWFWKPHATIAMHLPKSKFKAVKKFLKRKKDPYYNHLLVRATLLKDSKILYEYDFMLGKVLNRKKAKSRYLISKTLKIASEKN